MSLKKAEIERWVTLTEAPMTAHTRERLEARVWALECQYQMSSDTMRRKFADGDLDDENMSELMMLLEVLDGTISNND